jgi:hypothetical protein
LNGAPAARVTWSLVMETRAEAALLKVVSRVLTILPESPGDVWVRPWVGARPGREIRFSTPALVVDSPATAAGAVLETASQFFALWTVALRPESGILCQGWTPPEAGDGYVRGLVHGAFVVEIGDDTRSSANVPSGVRQRVVDGVIVNLAPVESA